MKEKTIVVFDVETSGLSARNDRVIELAAIKVEQDDVTEKFHTLIKFDGELPVRITDITGITQQELENEGKDEREVFHAFKDFIGDSLLVAHNAAFDLSFLHYSFLRNGLETFSNSFIDTLTICRELFHYPHKLIDMCDRLGIELNNAHRAYADVQATYELLVRLKKDYEVAVSRGYSDVTIKNWINRLGYLEKYGPPSWYPAHAEIFPTINTYENSW